MNTVGREHLGILVGLASEARALAAHLPPLGRLAITIGVSGARLAGAERETERLIASGVTALLSFGLAGALATDLTPGALLLPDMVVTADGSRYPTDSAWRTRLMTMLGELTPLVRPLLGVDLAVASAAEKAGLAQQTGAAAVDMESHVLARAARAAGLPFLVIRAVADTARTTLPPAALVGITAEGRTDLPAILRSLLRHPRQLPSLLRLGRDAAAGMTTLLGCARRGGLHGFGLGMR
jgi:adenosylhomocysteine nucleosidase